MGDGNSGAGYTHSSQIWEAQQQRRHCLVSPLNSLQVLRSSVWDGCCSRGSNELVSLQGEDEVLDEIRFLETGILPQDENRAKLIALHQAQYTLNNGVEID